MPSGKGIDMSVKLAMDPENAISTAPVVGGINDDEMSLAYIAGTPRMTDTYYFLEGTLPTNVAQIGIEDNYDSNVDLLMRCFRYWHGTLKFKFYITASLFHMVRGVFWLAELSADTSNWMNCYHKVVDIQGDTEVEFSVAYPNDKFAAASSETNMAIWFKVLSWSQPDISLSCPIAINVYKAAEQDIRFAVYREVEFNLQCNPRVDFNKPFAPLHPSMTGYEQKGLLFGEEYTSLREVLHKYQPINVNTTGDSQVYNFNTNIPNTWLGPEKWGFLYKYRRGSMRHKYVYKTPVTVPRSCYLYDELGPIVGMTCASTMNPIVEIEAPYYSSYLMLPACKVTDGSDPAAPVYSILRSTDATGAMSFRAMGDDFSYHFIRGFPPLNVNTCDPSRGSKGFTTWLNA
jgi:hypothetical protein